MSHQIRKNSPKREKIFHWEKREETFRRATDEDPSPRLDKSNRCHACVQDEQHYNVTTHSINMTEIMNN